MSRHILNLDIIRAIVVGWDPARKSYYLDFYLRPNSFEPVASYGRDGADKIETVDELERTLQIHGKQLNFTDSLRKQLKRDVTEEGYPAPKEALYQIDNILYREGRYKNG